MKVVFTRQAENDLESIADFIAADNPERAVSFVCDLRHSCLSLADMPEAFPLAQRYKEADVRRRVHGNFLILFRIGQDAVEVLRVVHGARDIEQLL